MKKIIQLLAIITLNLITASPLSAREINLFIQDDQSIAKTASALSLAMFEEQKASAWQQIRASHQDMRAAQKRNIRALEQENLELITGISELMPGYIDIIWHSPFNEQDSKLVIDQYKDFLEASIAKRTSLIELLLQDQDAKADTSSVMPTVQIPSNQLVKEEPESPVVSANSLTGAVSTVSQPVTATSSDMTTVQIPSTQLVKEELETPVAPVKSETGSRPTTVPDPVIEQPSVIPVKSQSTQPEPVQPKAQTVTRPRDKDGTIIYVTYTHFPGEEKLTWRNKKKEQITVPELKYIGKLNPNTDYSRYTQSQLDTAVASRGNINQHKLKALTHNPKHGLNALKGK